MKVRIFALAKELGLENKALVQLALDAGLKVKSSPLASVSEEQATQLREMAANKPAATATAAPPREEATPIRDAAGDRKLKDLGRTGGAGPLANRRRRRVEEEDVPVEETAAEVEDEIAAEAEPAAETPEEPVAEPEVAASEVEVDTPEVAEETTEVAEVVEAEAEKEPAEEPAAADSDEAEAEAEVEKVDAETTEEETAETVEPAAEAPKGISKDDYVSPRGRSIGVREMKAVGTVREGNRNTRAKKKSSEDKKPALPNIVLPNFTGPKGGEPKKDEPAAQKPDMTFTADILNQNSPLANRMRRDKDGKTGDKTGGGMAAGGRRPPTGLGDVRDHRQRSRQGRRGYVNPEDRIARRSLRARTRTRRGPIEYKTEATVQFPLSIRELCEEIGRPAKEVITYFFKQGTPRTINDMLTEEDALEACMDLGVELNIAAKESLEDKLLERVEAGVSDNAETVERPPIVTILGHVDHGKTTLVDRLRGSNVVDGEAGGITQHIAAYQVAHNDKKITFIDTPGHAAFGQMRARGANLTDIIVLVIAADDGVMPQTVESISHAKAAGVPIIVAMNKCDLPDRDEQKVLTDLAQQDMLPQEWGGQVEVIRVSALNGDGVDDLLETILLTAEIEEHKAAVDVDPFGICLEGFRDEGRGPMAWSIVQQGTLRIGDNILCGPAFGRVRAMYNDKDEELTEAGPSTPIRIAGLNEVPGAGDRLFKMDEIDDARAVAEDRQLEGRQEALARRGGGAKTLEQILAGTGPKQLPIIIKADTPGSIEAIRHEIDKFEHDEVAVRILHEGVGGVNESDVYLAASTNSIVIAFQVVADDKAESLASKEEVEIRRYSIIYEVADDIRSALEGLLDPDREEVATGRAIVLQTFSISRYGTIAGCRVLNGTINRNNRIHVIRDQTILNDYPIASLRREKDDTKEVREGFECGIRLDGFNDIKEGDLLEAFRIDEVKRTLSLS